MGEFDVRKYWAWNVGSIRWSLAKAPMISTDTNIHGVIRVIGSYNLLNTYEMITMIRAIIRVNTNIHERCQFTRRIINDKLMVVNL